MEQELSCQCLTHVETDLFGKPPFPESITPTPEGHVEYPERIIMCVTAVSASPDFVILCDDGLKRVDLCEI